MKLREAVVRRLSALPGEKLTARELAEWLIQTYPEACQAKAEKSGFPNLTALRNQLVAEIGSSRPGWMKKHPQLKVSADRPRVYFWSDLTDEQTVSRAESATPDSIDTNSGLPPESALYDMVIQFLRTEFGAFGMRIDEKRSSNRKGANGNKWLFPDVCAMQSLIEGLDADVISLINLTGAEKALLYSIEVKIVLNNSNVREAFFQAVSNSSWANFGYLVAAQIDDKVVEELRMLHGLHGIGVIRLNVDEPLESQIIIPARDNEHVDWSSFNRLTLENADFRNFSMRVKHFLQTNSVSASGWSLVN